MRADRSLQKKMEKNNKSTRTHASRIGKAETRYFRERTCVGTRNKYLRTSFSYHIQDQQSFLRGIHIVSSRLYLISSEKKG